MKRFLSHIIHAICFKLIKNCVVTAGFSLGEISALVFSGALTYEEGLHIIRVRAEAMQKACDEKAGAMITVFVNPGSPLKLGIAAAINHCEVRHKIQNPCCKVANYLYPDCKVIAGNKEAIDFIENHAGQFGIRRTKRLPVNGAFHTPLMSSARKIIANSLDRMGDFQEPSIPVISAVDVLPYRGTMNIKRKLAMQVYTSVLRICKKPDASINIWNLLKYFAITRNGAGHSRKHSRSPLVNHCPSCKMGANVVCTI
ncbi:[acyl-carrier protein] S-malonyltransferase [Schistosoma mansoni]|uniref:[acyl-carrier protein] S-malonyltransferase n=1 Tax=Schistosoma mansoni TaxID=6183 RepID=UPI0001A61B3F|nr:[acyl-carrier protein] S-malonyltransferase [Schistosoma mansoni]|eukprot:XP_018646923.1 [acyl-carrier protein] S-malonyltransferase [Schistosoma mansoni]